MCEAALSQLVPGMLAPDFLFLCGASVLTNGSSFEAYLISQDVDHKDFLVLLLCIFSSLTIFKNGGLFAMFFL